MSKLTLTDQLATMERQFQQSYGHCCAKGLALIAKLRQMMAALEDYGQHGRECILRYWEAGRPTPDGGYEMKYRGIWHRETPACQCEFDIALAPMEGFDV